MSAPASGYVAMLLMLANGGLLDAVVAIDGLAEVALGGRA
jgi:hypothetical protein